MPRRRRGRRGPGEPGEGIGPAGQPPRYPGQRRNDARYAGNAGGPSRWQGGAARGNQPRPSGNYAGHAYGQQNGGPLTGRPRPTTQGNAAVPGAQRRWTNGAAPPRGARGNTQSRG